MANATPTNDQLVVKSSCNLHPLTIKTSVTGHSSSVSATSVEVSRSIRLSEEPNEKTKSDDREVRLCRHQSLIESRRPTTCMPRQGVFTALDTKGDLNMNGANSVSLKAQQNLPAHPLEYISMLPEQETAARQKAEQAMRERKVFTVMGPYPGLRSALKRRGWVERFKTEAIASGEGSNTIVLPRSVVAEIAKKSAAGEKHEDGKTLAFMSHIVRNCTPTLKFTVNAVDVLSCPVKDFQIINHFAKASAFTTKTGLSQNLKNVHWFDDVDPMSFYPRCYNLMDSDEKQLFIEDYRLTACICFVKHFVAKFSQSSTSTRSIASKKSMLQKVTSLVSKPKTKSHSSVISVTDIKNIMNRNGSTPAAVADRVLSPQLFRAGECGSCPQFCRKATSKMKQISTRALHYALERCEQFIAERNHEDIDVTEVETFTESQWKQFIEVFHIFVRNQMDIDPKSAILLRRGKDILKQILPLWPQFHMEGIRNVWILKPGAKSRGRGIQCSDSFEEIFEIAAASNWAIVIQKYIERPLLVYSTKFDIRQWFLVTDWNPLTLWFYKACYIRFCSKKFSLDDFHISIHLSNNCIQKNFEPETQRAKELPDDNMWTHEEFVHHLRRSGHGEVFTQRIVPGMKRAIISTLLCTQEQVVQRKGTFELYGADFMMTDDFHPWLLEINSSPSMARTTKATEALVDCVLEDTIKVILDRKSVESCDTGNFELAFQQPLLDELPPLDVNLAVDGKLLLLRNAEKNSRSL